MKAQWIQLTSFAIMVSAYAWFASARTLAETTAPCLLAVGGLLLYVFASFWETSKG